MSCVCTLCPRRTKKQTRRLRSDPPGVCADMQKPASANHIILYISPLCNIQIPRQRCPTFLCWHLNKTGATLKCWHWLAPHNPPLNLPFFPARAQITALFHPEWLRAFALPSPWRLLSLNLVISFLFQSADWALWILLKKQKKNQNKNDPIPAWPTFLQQSHHFTVQLYNCAGMRRRRRQNNEKHGMDKEPI